MRERKESAARGKRADTSHICVGVGPFLAPEDDFIIQLPHRDGKVSGHWYIDQVGPAYCGGHSPMRHNNQ